MLKELSVAAIENGTVIDHIPAGQGLRIVHLLKLADYKKKVTLGLNLPSQSMGYKDLIKVEDREISKEEVSQIAVFAPRATLTIIRRFESSEKFRPQIPDLLNHVLHCPNPCCITNHEKMTTRFGVVHRGETVTLTCKYCEKSFAHDTY